MQIKIFLISRNWILSLSSIWNFLIRHTVLPSASSFIIITPGKFLQIPFCRMFIIPRKRRKTNCWCTVTHMTLLSPASRAKPSLDLSFNFSNQQETLYASLLHPNPVQDVTPSLVNTYSPLRFFPKILPLLAHNVEPRHSKYQCS